MQDNEAPRTEISTIGEFGLIDLITNNMQPANATTVLGVGDDAAIIDPMGKHIVVSTDMLVEGVHFDMSYTPLRYLGYKAVVVNLSDIYAMMGTPTQITVSIAVSNRYSVQAITELYEGIQEACDTYKVDLVGGDTTTSPNGLVISVTAIGEIVEGKQVLRSGAKENDLVCVSGTLGAAYLGLLLLEREKQVFLETKSTQPDFGDNKHILQKLLRPEARHDIITMLQDLDITPTSMIDISDGLSSELMHICKASKVGCMLYEDKIPTNDQARISAMDFNISITTCALNGGEDYELLFTISQADYEKIKDNLFVTTIGYISPQADGMKLTTKGNNVHTLVAQGWNHGNKK